MSRTSACGISRTLTCLLVAAACSGCGGDPGYVPPDGIILKGTIVQGGSPLHVERPDVGLGFIELVLIPRSADPNDDTADFNATLAEPDGTFVFEGAGKGIPAGNYRLAVYHYEQGPEADKLEGAFSGENTSIQITVSEDNMGDEQDLGVIDLNEQGSQSNAANG